ncbi:endolytic transglycosylase MltG [Treponema parvum]|uniref:Endolytic murein transglycosylase n=1 Tax=Treponema parvum TaxID=138851 RepID=A0A975F3Z9_9SPIR|nr:endolytic transglycosylase MltG [Treponema parvum]QTQ13928.1 endolytic transglycosylase MltG [Treponema parvum]
MNKKIAKMFKVFFAVFVSLAACLYFYWVYACGAVNSYGTGRTERIEVPYGMTIKEIAAVLKEKKLIHNETVFYLAARYPFLDKSEMNGLQDSNFNLKSGVYEVSSEMGLSEIFNLLSSGTQEYIKISIPEGFSVKKIAKKLADRNVCSEKDFIEAANSKPLLAEYNIDADSFEGYLFPDTYFFTPFMSGKQVVKFMANNFFSKIAEIPSFTGISPKKLNDSVILASIVEKEYRIASEAPLIASVFKNRLDKNIGLYSCATIEYILTEIEGLPHPDVITYENLQISSPYNTYKWAGLPPGAICNPGMIALKAVADTPKTNYYFFRLTDLQRGSHSFSSDFRTHIEEGQLLYTKKTSEN